MWCLCRFRAMSLCSWLINLTNASPFRLPWGLRQRATPPLKNNKIYEWDLSINRTGFYCTSSGKKCWKIFQWKLRVKMRQFIIFLSNRSTFFVFETKLQGFLQQGFICCFYCISFAIIWKQNLPSVTHR